MLLVQNTCPVGDDYRFLHLIKSFEGIFVHPQFVFHLNGIMILPKISFVLFSVLLLIFSTCKRSTQYRNMTLTNSPACTQLIMERAAYIPGCTVILQHELSHACCELHRFLIGQDQEDQIILSHSISSWQNVWVKRLK